MKIVDGFTLRSVAGEWIVAGESIDQINFNKLIAFNDSAAYLWQQLVGKDFTVEQMASELLAEYEVSEATAMADAQTLANSWLEVGLVK